MADARPQEIVASWEAPQQERETLLLPQRKKDGVTPHTLHLTRRVQQDNPEGSMRKEVMPQQLSFDEKSQHFNVKGKVVSKQQTKPTHTTQCNDLCEANGAVEGHAEGGVKRKREGEVAGFVREDKHQRETPETLSR